MPYHARDLGAGSRHCKCDAAVNGSRNAVLHIGAQLTPRISSFDFIKLSHIRNMHKANSITQAESFREAWSVLTKTVRDSNIMMCQS